CGLEGSPFYVLREPAPWPQQDGPRRAGVSSFGLGGTNVHAVLEEAPEEEVASTLPFDTSATHSPVPFCFSARSAKALSDYVERYVEWLSHPLAEHVTFRDLAFTSSVRRTHHEHRLVAIAHSPSELREHLRGYLRGEAGVEVATGRALEARSPCVFVL